MKNKTTRILSLWLAVAAIVTSIAFPVYAEGTTTNLSLTTATPSTATCSSTTRLTAATSTATPSNATPSTSDVAFEKVEPETIPEYYRPANYRGRKFWKFVDRTGKNQYRDYGVYQEEVGVHFWYSTDEKGNIKDRINPDTEYDLAPFLYKSQNPSKENWQELSLILASEKQIFYSIREPETFENWNSSVYQIWHLKADPIQEGAVNNVQGYFFYGRILNHKDSEANWYFADAKGTVLDPVLNNPMPLATVLCRLNSNFDAPGTYRSSKAVVTNITDNPYTLGTLLDRADNHFKDETVDKKINFTSNFVGWSTSRSTDNHITVNAVTGIEYVQGDPAGTSKYFSLGTFYPPKHPLDVTYMSSANLYGIWCPKNADMYIFAGEQYKGEMQNRTNSYRLQAIIVRRGTSFDVSLVGNPARYGQTFKGWYYYDGNRVDIPADGSLYCGSSGKVTYVYPDFVSNTNTVTFKDADGSIIKTESVALGGDATPPADPSRPGYTFIGWDKGFTNITSPTIVTAQYKANPYNLTIHGNGGLIEGNASKELTVDCGASIDELLAAAKASSALKNHIFEGWYTQPTEGNKYPTTGNKMPAGDVAIYAHWSRNSSLVIYKDWNGTTLKSEEVPVGGDATPPEDPVHPGYTFTGWDKVSTGIQDHTTITAQYSVNRYVLTLDGNGGTLDGIDKQVVTADYDSSLDQILSNTKENAVLKYHTLEGWYTQPTEGNKYPTTGNKMPAGDILIYAHWSRNSSLVTYVDWDGNILKTEEVPIGGNATPPTVPTRPGYIFNGWDKKSENIQDHITITAQYTAANEDTGNQDNLIPPAKEEAEPNNTKDNNSDDSDTVYNPSEENAEKPGVPDHGGDFTVNPDNPFDITYTKPDGSKGRDEWVGDGEDWFHINHESKVDYDWYLDKQSWYMLNKDISGKIGAAKFGWYYESMDNKWYYFDTANAAMKIGWQSIDNQWYYFTVVNNGQTYFGDNDKGWAYNPNIKWKPFGSMFINEKTPDGYFVDESGVWNKQRAEMQK